MTDTPRPPGAQAAPSWRDVLPEHPACKLFEPMSADELRELGEDIKKHGLKNQIVLWQPGAPGDRDQPLYLLDGRNRLDALERMGACFVRDGKFDRAGGRSPWRISVLGECRIERGEQDRTAVALDGSGRSKTKREPGCDPYAFVISVNVHRRHLTLAQRDEVFKKLRKAQPEKSIRQHAKAAGISHTHGSKVQAELEAAGDVATVATSIDIQGRRQPAKKPSKPARSGESSGMPSARRPTPAAKVARAAEDALPRREAAAQAQQDVGPGSQGEHARLEALNEQLRNEKRQLATRVIGLESEVQELKATAATPGLGDLITAMLAASKRCISFADNWTPAELAALPHSGRAVLELAGKLRVFAEDLAKARRKTKVGEPVESEAPAAAEPPDDEFEHTRICQARGAPRSE
jgi:hypothetical protein